MSKAEARFTLWVEKLDISPVPPSDRTSGILALDVYTKDGREIEIFLERETLLEATRVDGEFLPDRGEEISGVGPSQEFKEGKFLADDIAVKNSSIGGKHRVLLLECGTGYLELHLSDRQLLEVSRVAAEPQEAERSALEIAQ